MSVATTYRHTQKAPLYLPLIALAIAFFAIALFFHHQLPPFAIVMGIAGAVILILAFSFQHLSVTDEGDRLAIQFGPIPIFRKTIRYEDIQEVEVAKTTVLDGWGIHMSLRGGWVWNIWGRDCVMVRHQGITWIGTDDAEGLAQFLKTKMQREQEQ